MANTRQRSDFEIESIGKFLQHAFPADFKPLSLAADEMEVLGTVEGAVKSAFSTMKYLLGLTVDFAMVAQQLSDVDSRAKAFQPDLTKEELFNRYQRVDVRGKKKSNTLTLVCDNKGFGIRKIEELFFTLIHGMNRTSYPSAYVYNTGQWRKFEDILIGCFRLSDSGRWNLCNDLIDYCLDTLPEDRLFGRKKPRVYLFPRIINEYKRTAKGENAGLTLQAIVYGYAKADRPHLSLSVDKVRGGSSRQRRFGDVDGYYGIDLELSMEVKDKEIDEGNVQKELGTFAKKVQYNRISGLAIVRDIDEALLKELGDAGVSVLTLLQLHEDVLLWDWRKQDDSLHGMLHYLAHVEQNVFAVQRLLSFIKSLDDGHDSLAYVDEVATAVEVQEKAKQKKAKKEK